MIKKIVKKTVIGIAMGSTILNLLLLIFKLTGLEQAFALTTDDYIRQSLCAILAAIIFNVLAIVYDYDTIGHGIKTLIHMGIGLACYFVIAYYAHWLPVNNGFKIMAISIIFMLFGSFAIWFCFYLHYRKEAKQMNAKITKLK